VKFLHSHSAHESFDTCRAKFLLQQQGAPRRPDAPNFAFGKTAHLFFKLYRDHCIEQRRWSDIEAIGSLLDEAFRITGLSTRNYEELQLLCRMWASYQKIDIERSVMREGGIAFDENLKPLAWGADLEYDSPTFKAIGSRAAVRMQIDETLVDPIEQQLILWDWKTDMYVPSQSEIEDPSGRWWKQANEYAWGALRALYPTATGVTFEFKFVRWNVTRTLYLSREDVERYGELFVRRIQFIEATEKFTATPGNHCRTCPFLSNGCPLADSLLLDEYETDIEEVAARYLYDDAVQERRRDQLKEHADVNGIIYVDGLPLAIFEKQERKVMDVALVLDALRAEGIDNPELMLDVSPSKLKESLDSDQLARVLKVAAASTEQVVVFNVYQKKEELVALADSLGIPDAKSMKKAQLAQAIARAGAQKAA
jgi:hypothetical protein